MGVFAYQGTKHIRAEIYTKERPYDEVESAASRKFRVPI